MWMKIGRFAPYIFLYILSFFIVGLFNFVTADVNSTILTAEFWNKTISQNIANLMVLLSTIMLYSNKQMTENEEYLQMTGIVRRAVREDIQSDFGQWVYDKNKIEKIKAYQEKVKGQINKEERKAKTEDLKVWYYGTPEEKEVNEYCQKRLKQMRMIEDEYLENFIISMKVDYDEIDRSFIETGEKKSNPKQNAKQASVLRIIKDNAPRYTLGASFAVFFNAFIYEADLMDPAFWFRLAFSMAILVFMFLQGREYAFDYMRKVLLVDLQTRFNIIRDYLSEKVKEVKNATKL